MSEDDFFNFEEVPIKERSPHLVPWVVTGMVAVVALLIAVLVLNLSRGGEDQAEPKPTQTAEPSPSATTTPSPKPTATTPTPTPTTPNPARPDDSIDTSRVVVEPTHELLMDWDGWRVTAQASNKLYPYSYDASRGNILVIDSELIQQLPASCAHMKDKWGLEQVSPGQFKAYSPQEMCVANESLYIELLGIVRHLEKTVKPL